MQPAQLKKYVLVRDAEPDDHSFLFSTYLRNNWYSKTQTTTLKKATWMGLQHRRLEKVLEDQTVKVACLSEDPDTIIGYCFKDGKEPFTYVKLAWRAPNLNIAKILNESLENP